LVGRGLFDAVTRRVTITANMQAIITSGLDSFYLETRVFDAAEGRWRTTYGAANVTLDNNSELVLPVAATFGAIPPAGTPVFFRLWDGIRAITDSPVGPNPTELEDGIRLEFATLGNDLCTCRKTSGSSPCAPARSPTRRSWSTPSRRRASAITGCRSASSNGTARPTCRRKRAPSRTAGTSSRR